MEFGDLIGLAFLIVLIFIIGSIFYNSFFVSPKYQSFCADSDYEGVKYMSYNSDFYCYRIDDFGEVELKRVYVIDGVPRFVKYET